MADVAEFDVGVEYANARLRDKYEGVYTKILEITPEVAREMLVSNTRNRPVNKIHLNHLEGVFRQGDMILNGETIIFNADGVLLNGQHRLMACVNTGVSFDAMVVYGISDPMAFKTQDGGKKRSTPDSLALGGEVMCHNLAAAIQGVVAFVDFGGQFRETTTGSRRATPQLADRFLERYPDIRASVQAMARTKLFNNQTGYTLHWLFSRVDKRLAAEFAEVLASGDSDTRRPFVVFREHLIRQPLRPHLRKVYAGKAIKAFNAERNGQRPSILKLLKEEAFPQIDGLDIDRLKETI